MSTARQQPPWKQPVLPPESSSKLAPLKVWNSLTRSKTPFIPRDPSGKITWYVCGPTVYDDAHLGHARNYVTTDILRRILRDYFKFNVRFIMNITDVDDKIIVRGRQQHLFTEYVSKHPTISAEVLETAQLAYSAYVKKNLPLVDHDIPPAEAKREVETKYHAVLTGGTLQADKKPGDDEAKIKMHIKTVLSAANVMADARSKPGELLPETFYSRAQDVFLPYLDTLHGSSIGGDDYDIFTKLTKRYEARFLQDMRDLNVLDPDELTRVTEYGVEIADFVAKIVDNKFAYVMSDGSVYFDIEAFEAAGNHYARLEPWNRNNQVLLADGEGALSKKSVEKRSRADFALWKASRPGEPSWASAWGKGRPGWHIECSAMASAKLGEQMDIHSGGIDLAFPHHDNELAQSEAYWQTSSQWVNYFLHMGHLSIQGSKMSKSLKNFVTIREALDKGEWTSRSLRIIFLLGNWREGIEITEDLIKAGNSWEDKVNNFFLNTRELNAAQDSSTSAGLLTDAFETAKKAVYDALCDSFNTSVAMQSISDLISTCNSTDKAKLNPTEMVKVARWVTSMVNIFGLNGTASPDTEDIGWYGIDVPDVAKPYLYPLASMRDSLRDAAKSKSGLSVEALKDIVATEKPAEQDSSDAAKPFADVLSNFRAKVSSLAQSDDLSKEVLSICDRVRDIDLFDLGVYLEDRDGLPSLVRPITKELTQARDEKTERARQKKLEKEKKDKEAQEKMEKGKLSHLEMFRTNEFSAWDEEGLPTKSADGQEVTKSRSKKLRKDWERQKKAHEAWQASATNGS